jgi:hypothetical protein
VSIDITNKTKEMDDGSDSFFSSRSSLQIKIVPRRLFGIILATPV